MNFPNKAAKTLKHPILREQAYAIIKNKLLNQEIAPGARIREDVLAEEISMSRTPVREAVNQLAAEGFISYVPRKGLFAVELSRKELQDLLDVRLSLELLSVDRCIDLIDEDGKQLVSVKRILKKWEQAIENGRYHECNGFDSEFHIGIAHLTQNIKLITYLQDIGAFMQIARVTEKKRFTEEMFESSFIEHKEICAAIERKDRETAFDAVRENIQNMKMNMGI